MLLTGQPVRHVWDVGPNNSGLAATMTGRAFLSPDATTYAEQTQIVVSFVETSTPGVYDVSYVPDAGGVWQLEVRESTAGLLKFFQAQVSVTGDTAIRDTAFCSEKDVATRVGVKDFRAASQPDEGDVGRFMDDRAAELVAEMARELGADPPGPAASDNPLDSTTYPGQTLARVLRSANAVGAAIDVLHGLPETPPRAERQEALEAEWTRHIQALPNLSRFYIGHTSRTEVLVDPLSADNRAGLPFNSRTEF